MRGTLAVLLGLCGCNAIFGLDSTHVVYDHDAATIDGPIVIDAVRTDAPPCAPIGHDEDGDGVDDGCDLCPQLASAGDMPDVDSDGDGIGDACDPNPGDGGDVLLFFDSFAVPSSWNGLRGTWNRQDDAFAELDISTALSLAVRTFPDMNATDFTVDVVFTLDAELPVVVGESPAWRGIAVWFVASGATASTDPNGYICQLLEDLAAPTPTTTLALSAYKAPDATELGVMGFNAHAALGTPGRFRVQHRSDTQLREACHFELGQIAADFSTLDATFSSGTIAIRTVKTAVHITSVTAYGRKL